MCSPGPLFTPLPSSLVADERAVSIPTDFRHWLQVWRVLSAEELTGYEKQNLVLLNILGFLPLDAAGAMEQLLRFFLCEKEPDSAPPRERLLDWASDWPCIWADFWMYARLDLDTAPLHWWRFLALFESLPKDSAIKRRISTRGVNLSDVKDPTLREQYRQMKAAVALEPLPEADWEAFYRGQGQRDFT